MEVFRPIEAKWLVQAVAEAPFYSFYLGAPNIRGVAYLPNFAPRLGPRVVYRQVGETLTFSLPIPKIEVDRRGDSEANSFILNSYWRQFAYDLYYQHYQGFYSASPFTELSFRKPSRYPQMPDARVVNYGINAYWVLRPEKYSLKAAFDQNEFQMESGGSWILNPYYGHLRMFLGGRFVPGSDSSALPDLPNLSTANFDTTGLAVGYGYTYIKNHLFFSGQAAYGPGLQYQDIDQKDGGDRHVLSLAAKLNVNAAAGWNYPDHVTGAKLLVDSTWAKVLDTQVSATMVSLQAFWGKRF